MKYICYLSLHKVDALYSQLGDFRASKIQQKTEREIHTKAGFSTPSLFGLVKGDLDFGGRRRGELVVEGEISPMQKLRAVIEHLETQGEVGDLNEAIANGRVEPGTICYSYSGLFSCEKDAPSQVDPDYIDSESKACERPMKHWTGLKAVSSMTTLFSGCGAYSLVVAASYKYFSDMGGSRVFAGKEASDEDLVSIHPHSGNHLFFAGLHKATFDTILFVVGQRGQVLYCSPLVIVNSFSPNLTL